MKQLEKNYMPDDLPRVSLEEAESVVDCALDFMRKNPKFFKVAPSLGINGEIISRLYSDCVDIAHDLNMAAKSLLAQGGKVPLIDVITELIEKLNLVLEKEEDTNESLYTEYIQLGSGEISGRGKHGGYKPLYEDFDIELSRWSAMRTITGSRKIDEEKFKNTQPEKFDDLPINYNGIVTINDIIHIEFFRELGANDLDWMVLNLFVDYINDSLTGARSSKIKQRIRKLVEGAIWRNHQVAAAIRQLEKEAGRPKKGNSILTIASEKRLDNGLYTRSKNDKYKTPTFFAGTGWEQGEMDFGSTKEETEEKLVKIPNIIERHLLDIYGAVLMAIRGQYRDVIYKNLLRGGTDDYNPATLYEVTINHKEKYKPKYDPR